MPGNYAVFWSAEFVELDIKEMCILYNQETQLIQCLM